MICAYVCQHTHTPTHIHMLLQKSIIFVCIIMNVNKILKNNIVLTVIWVICTINVIGYVSIAAYECILVFVLAGYALKNFVPYTSVQLLGGLLIANILFGCGRARNSGVWEGLEDKKDEANELIAKLKELVPIS